ncbi:hypothetical protein EV702DRAFT_1275376 [Suillus placidus]|uniref:Uncharacterized protein n=1 Tax=Suillus placidus TaxID=48579 RepID=A0A9P7D6A8_9AGAM|nr:hypothetical protein EV702DRAFT_1275376 [Suillus placidus]
MDLPDSSLEPGDLPELLACYTSVSTHQPAGSHSGFVASDHSDHLITVPFENRNRAVVDGFVGPTHILHAPQLSRPLMYQWSGSTYMGSYSLANNHTMGMGIPRPTAPSPILAMQNDLLENFLDVWDIPPPHPPPRNHSTIRFEPYHNDRPHKYHGAFLCRWDNEGSLCGDELQAAPKDILAHLRQDHGIGIGNKETYRCLWITAYGRCEEQLRFQSFGRHIIKHAGIRIKCSLCDMTMPARNDLATRHRHHHPNCSQADFTISYPSSQY